MAELQRQNWDYTNAENQRKHYENAGLNVGLKEKIWLPIMYK